MHEIYMLHIHCGFSFRGPHVRLASLLLTELPPLNKEFIIIIIIIIKGDNHSTV